MATTDGTAADDELWTAGQAAAYLNAGGVNLGITARHVTDLIKEGELSAVRHPARGWRRTPASGIRRLRFERLAELGRVDPGYTPPPEPEPDTDVSAG